MDEKTKQLLQRAIDLARREINQQRPQLALRHLDDRRREALDCDDSLLLAQYQLARGEALATTNDPSAGTDFEDTLLQLSHLPDRDLLLEMRAHEHFARYLRHNGRKLKLYGIVRAQKSARLLPTALKTVPGFSCCVSRALSTRKIPDSDISRT